VYDEDPVYDEDTDREPRSFASSSSSPDWFFVSTVTCLLWSTGSGTHGMKTRNTRKTERLNCARVGAIASAGARRIETMPTRRDVKSSCHEGGKQQQGCFALYIINNR